jgi:hypothetical protein
MMTEKQTRINNDGQKKMVLQGTENYLLSNSIPTPFFGASRTRELDETRLEKMLRTRE